MPEPANPEPPPQSTISIHLTPCETTGDRIGRYKLLEQIGEGGCGVVYVAQQEEPVRRQVALKVIKLGMDTRQVIARFEAERQALALMDHPNIAKVLDGGSTQTGRPFFVMELVKGVRITDYCDRNNLSTTQRLNLFIKVCQAIQHAHQKGIIHRDIKPSNVLVALHDGVAVPKVIDFGIAKATTGHWLTDKTVHTAIDQFIGTPAYMSPEQAELTRLDIDTRSDIYALGVLLYELLTGKTPFDSKRLFEAGLDEVRRIIREEEPPRPSTCISTLNAQEQTALARRHASEPPKVLGIIRGDLDWIVMKTLEKDRNRRYETANGLARDIERFIGNEPVAARPPSTVYRFQKLVRRNKLAVGAAGAVALALLLGLAIATWALVNERESRKEAEHQRHLAESNQNKAQAEAAKSQQVAHFLEEMLAGIDPAVASGQDTIWLREILQKTAGRVGKGLKGDPEVEAELRDTIGSVYYAMGDYKPAAEMDQTALELRQQVFGPKHPLVAKSMDHLGLVLWRQGKFPEATSMFRGALAMQKQFHNGPDLDIVATLNHLATVLNSTRNLPEAETLLREAVEMDRKLRGEDDPGGGGNPNKPGGDTRRGGQAC
jgi:serine/threonine protein kinase